MSESARYAIVLCSLQEEDEARHAASGASRSNKAVECGVMPAVMAHHPNIAKALGRERASRSEPAGDSRSCGCLQGRSQITRYYLRAHRGESGVFGCPPRCPQASGAREGGSVCSKLGLWEPDRAPDRSISRRAPSECDALITDRGRRRAVSDHPHPDASSANSLRKQTRRSTTVVTVPSRESRCTRGCGRLGIAEGLAESRLATARCASVGNDDPARHRLHPVSLAGAERQSPPFRLRT